MPTSQETFDRMEHTVHMAGNQVFKHAVRAMSESAVEAVKEAGVGIDEVKLLIPHQANTRIMEATRTRVGIPPEKQFTIFEFKQRARIEDSYRGHVREGAGLVLPMAKRIIEAHRGQLELSSKSAKKPPPKRDDYRHHEVTATVRLPFARKEQ